VPSEKPPEPTKGRRNSAAMRAFLVLIRGAIAHAVPRGLSWGGVPVEFFSPVL
jgi:hypothetical protein